MDDLLAEDAAPLKAATLVTDRVAKAIRELILSGEFAPGSRIGQEDLAARFGVSRIPVRGALAQLENDGLVVLKPSSGAWVAKVDLDECLELYMIRERLEPLALSMSVPNMSPQTIDGLERLVVAMADTPDSETFLGLDRRFHLASYRDAQMSQLYGMIERFWNSTQHYRRAFIDLLGPERNWIIHAEHRLMIDAMRQGDADGAAHLLYEHIRRTRRELSAHAGHFLPDRSPRKRRSK